jgi:hypothetical protein
MIRPYLYTALIVYDVYEQIFFTPYTNNPHTYKRLGLLAIALILIKYWFFKKEAKIN